MGEPGNSSCTCILVGPRSENNYNVLIFSVYAGYRVQLSLVCRVLGCSGHLAYIRVRTGNEWMDGHDGLSSRGIMVRFDLLFLYHWKFDCIQ